MCACEPQKRTAQLGALIVTPWEGLEVSGSGNGERDSAALTIFSRGAFVGVGSAKVRAGVRKRWHWGGRSSFFFLFFWQLSIQLDFIYNWSLAFVGFFFRTTDRPLTIWLSGQQHSTKYLYAANETDINYAKLCVCCFAGSSIWGKDGDCQFRGAYV